MQVVDASILRRILRVRRMQRCSGALRQRTLFSKLYLNSGQTYEFQLISLSTLAFPSLRSTALRNPANSSEALRQNPRIRTENETCL